MSKQSNQRYRKEIEKDNQKKAGNEKSAVELDTKNNNRDKINREFNSSSDRLDR